MYPTIVVVLVETRRSMTDICEIGPSNASKIAGSVASDHEARATSSSLGHSSFAVGPNNSMMDNEGAESPPSCSLQCHDVQERSLEKVILEINSKESQVSTSG